MSCPEPVPPSLQQRALRSLTAILVGQAALLLVQFGAGVVLARRLSPADFGTFAVLMYLVSLGHALSDFGQGTVLVQRPEEPRPAQWRTAFALQLGGAVVFSLLVGGLARPLARAFGVGEEFIEALPWILLSVLVAPLERVSGAVLERRMAYWAISAVSLVGGMLYAAVALSLVWSGFGLWGLVGGALAASFGRALVSLWLSRWPMGVQVERAFLVESVKRGRYCQLTDLLGFLREQTPQLVAAPLFGPAAVGYLVWARNLTYVSHYLFASAFTRVGFALMARLSQARGFPSQAPSVGRLVEAMTFALMSIMVAFLALLLGLARPVVAVIYTEKWMPAIPALYLFGIRMLGGGIFSLFLFFLNGVGQFRLTARAVAAWTALEVGGAVLLAPHMGFFGVAMASALAVWLPVFWLVRHLAAFLRVRGESLRFSEIVGKPVLIGGVVGIILHGLGQNVSDLGEMAVVAACGAGIFALTLLSWSRLLRGVGAWGVREILLLWRG